MVQLSKLLETKKGIRLGLVIAGIVFAAVLLFGVIRFLTLPPLGLKPGTLLEASYKIRGGPYHIGDLIPVELEFAAVSGVKFGMPDPAATGLGKLELVKNLGQSGAWRRGGRLERARYIITAWNVGAYRLPGFTFPYWRDGIKGVYRVKPVKLQIVSVLPPGKSRAELLKLDLKPHKGPLELPPRYDILWVSLSILAFIALLAFGIRRLRNYLKQRPQRPAPVGTLPAQEVPEPAHSIAFRRLDDLERADYLAAGSFKAYYTELSEIIREYMENRFQTKALEMTTEEFLNNLAGSAILGVLQQSLLRNFLLSADLVKFAKQIPPEAEARENLSRIRRLVGETAATMQPNAPQSVSGPEPAAQV